MRNKTLFFILFLIKFGCFNPLKYWTSDIYCILNYNIRTYAQLCAIKKNHNYIQPRLDT